jgi:hypothetical protein
LRGLTDRHSVLLAHSVHHVFRDQFVLPGKFCERRGAVGRFPIRPSTRVVECGAGRGDGTIDVALAGGNDRAYRLAGGRRLDSNFVGG